MPKNIPGFFMSKKWLGVLGLLILLAGPAKAETIHLTTGEIIRGRIVEIEEDVISVESERGFGVLQIQKSEISLIEYDEVQRNPDRTMGLGYMHRVTPNTAGKEVVEYGVDALSLKFWMSPENSLDLLLGFFSSELDGEKDFEVFSFDVRWAHVFKRQAQLDLYYGGSVGFISVVDKTGTTPLDDSGQTIRAFLGAEIFLISLPNLGISGEVGIGTQSVGDRKITSISTTTFPSLSIRYYF